MIYQFPKMINYRFSSTKFLIFIILFVLYLFVLFQITHHYFSHNILANIAILFFTLMAIGRAFGTFLMYPGSFRFTRSQVELRESQYLMQSLHISLRDLESLVQKFLRWDIQSLKRQRHYLSRSKLRQSLETYYRIVKKCPQTPSKIQLQYCFQDLFKEIEFQIAFSDGMAFSIARLLISGDELLKIREDDAFEKIRQVAKNIQYLCHKIWNISLSIMYNFESQRQGESLFLQKYKIAAWQLFGERIFNLQSYFAYWDTLFSYSLFDFPTSDGHIIQCAIIHKQMLSQKKSAEKAVLFNNPNGAYLQSIALSSSFIKFYLKNNLQVVLWNYRGYGRSTGTPSIKKSIQDCEEIYHYIINKFGLKIQVIHGYSIGGPCAIHLARKYAHDVKLLIADRTFSRVDLVAISFLPELKFGKALISKISSLIVSSFFYSDCVNNSKNFRLAQCRKVIIWATFDEIVQNRSSLKYGLIKILTQFNEYGLQADSKKEEIELQEEKTQNQMNKTEKTFEEKDIKMILQGAKKFSQAMVGLCEFSGPLYHKLMGELRKIEGNKLPPFSNGADKALGAHQQFFLEMISFSASQNTQNQIHAMLRECRDIAIGESEIITGESGKGYLLELGESLQIAETIIKNHYHLFLSWFGNLLVTDSGHNGQLDEEYCLLQKILRNSLKS